MTPTPPSSPRMRGSRVATRKRLLWVPACAGMTILAPLLLPPFYVTLAGYIGLATLVALGLVLLTGISGQTSFGQASFVGLLPMPPRCSPSSPASRRSSACIAGLLVTGIIAWLLGLITARLSGHFLALVSVAWGISFSSLFGTLPLLHGFNGIGDIPPLLGAPQPSQRVNSGRDPRRRRSRHGDVGQPARQPYRAARMRTLNGARLMGASMGIDTVRLSRQVFVIAALYAALAGFLFAHFQRFVSPTPFGLGTSIDYLFMVIIGGAESLWGAPLGAALVVVLRDQFNDWIPRLTGRSGDFEALVFSPGRHRPAATRPRRSDAAADAPLARIAQRPLPPMPKTG